LARLEDEIVKAFGRDGCRRTRISAMQSEELAASDVRREREKAVT
jgi:hypothetical protein